MSTALRLDLSDWQVVTSFLPADWEQKAKELGALRRCRKITEPGTLLRLLLMHLADGCSLRETVAVARAGGIANISDVALMKRLSASGEWLSWLCSGVMSNWVQKQPDAVFKLNRKVVVVDGSMIKEPGPTGSSWRLHYAIDLSDLRCTEAHVTDRRTAESLDRFDIKKGDIYMADRGYGRASDICYAVDRGADVVVRIYHRNIRLAGAGGKRFSLLRRLRTVRGTQVREWDAWVVGEEGWSHPVRVCAVRLSSKAAEKARKKVRRTAQKSGYKASANALEAAGYVTVLTTMPRSDISAERVMEMYRGRWQIELVFKRMKSIMELGHLHKATDASIKAWIHGKLLVAFLIEAMITAGESFFPWGYPLPAPRATQSLPVARGELHAPPA